MYKVISVDNAEMNFENLSVSLHSANEGDLECKKGGSCKAGDIESDPYSETKHSSKEDGSSSSTELKNDSIVLESIRYLSNVKVFFEKVCSNEVQNPTDGKHLKNVASQVLGIIDDFTKGYSKSFSDDHNEAMHSNQPYAECISEGSTSDGIVEPLCSLSFDEVEVAPKSFSDVGDGRTVANVNLTSAANQCAEISVSDRQPMTGSNAEELNDTDTEVKQPPLCGWSANETSSDGIESTSVLPKSYQRMCSDGDGDGLSHSQTHNQIKYPGSSKLSNVSTAHYKPSEPNPDQACNGSSDKVFGPPITIEAESNNPFSGVQESLQELTPCKDDVEPIKGIPKCLASCIILTMSMLKSLVRLPGTVIYLGDHGVLPNPADKYREDVCCSVSIPYVTLIEKETVVILKNCGNGRDHFCSADLIADPFFDTFESSCNEEYSIVINKPIDQSCDLGLQFHLKSKIFIDDCYNLKCATCLAYGPILDGLKYPGFRECEFDQHSIIKAKIGDTIEISLLSGTTNEHIDWKFKLDYEFMVHHKWVNSFTFPLDVGKFNKLPKFVRITLNRMVNDDPPMKPVSRNVSFASLDKSSSSDVSERNAAHYMPRDSAQLIVINIGPKNYTSNGCASQGKK